ncbi:hypothetical protein ACFY4B_27505 [Kitasatospora sp. NPDC001261]|uniref:hypothetical protein n=1 Tax=Kitasatospora sp. NPDC001261 TaxID=3364012 RepID=UPI0036BB14FB
MAAEGPLTAVGEYGALRYLTSTGGAHHGAVLRPDAAHECAERGWIEWSADRSTAAITDSGRAALAEYRRELQELEALPCRITRNPLTGAVHDPREALRVLRDRGTGAEIPPGATVTDPAGETVTYLGPTMEQQAADAPWLPGRTARVLYAGGTPWVYRPVDLGAAYDENVRVPAHSQGRRP